MLDNLATRYHLLPSQVLMQADSLDLLVMDVSLSWERHQREQAEAKSSGRPPKQELSVNTMQEMLDRVRKGQ